TSSLARRKEPALSRRPRHRASATASRGEPGTGAARHSRHDRRRARLLLVLAFVCGALPIAVPLALVVGGPTDGGGASRDPEGVFTGADDGSVEDGNGSTGRGGGALS